jgi:GNAT superfamily N-acetyltransferase
MPYFGMPLRRAEPADALAVARVHVRSWQQAYRGLMPGEYLDQLKPEDRAARYDFATRDPDKPHTILAVEGDQILGFVTTGPSRTGELLDHGEMYALYLDPEHWGRGFGVTLVEAGRARLAELGFLKACLWVLDGNVRAERFYLRDGWAPDGERRKETILGIEVNDCRYRREL